MDSKSYVDGMSYETFMCRAFKKERHQVAGGDGSYMKNLIDTENGLNMRRLAGSYEKQLEQVKKYMDKALDKYLKFNLTAQERTVVEHLKAKLPQVTGSSALMAIVEDGLAATERFTAFM